MATVPAGTITRMTVQYDVEGVQCFSSLHIQQASPADDTVWSADMQACLAKFATGLRNLTTVEVDFVRAIARALDAPGVYPAIYNFNGIGGTLIGTRLPPICYVGINYFGQQPETTKKRRNQIRVSGLPEQHVSDNALSWGIVNFMRNYIEQNWLPDFYESASNVYNWVLVHKPSATSALVPISVESVNVRPEVYTLQSRKS